MVEVANGEVVRAESPSRRHQSAAHRLQSILDSAAETHMSRYQDGCLDVSTDFDLLLWELPRVTIRRPDVALHACAPDDLRPLPASMAKLVIEIVSPGTEFVDTADKLAEYAIAGIPWYWIVRIEKNSVVSIKTYVLDHVVGLYRPHVELEPPVGDGETIVDVPIRIKIDWSRLTDLVRT